MRPGPCVPQIPPDSWALASVFSNLIHRHFKRKLHFPNKWKTSIICHDRKVSRKKKYSEDIIRSALLVLRYDWPTACIVEGVRTADGAETGASAKGSPRFGDRRRLAQL